MIKIGNIELPDCPLLLAPMEDVSDPPFRDGCKKLGADLMYSEFISSEGLIRDAIKSKKKLDFSEEERPFGIQIFGGDEEAMIMSAKIVNTVNPDLVDINFGCPVKKVVSKGAGAAVLKDIDLMTRLTKSVVQSCDIPTTVKTRLGWDDSSKNIVEVALRLQEVGIKALTIHGRTRAQLYKGEADWDLIQKVKEHPEIEIPIFGNGDIDSPQKALEYYKKYKVDGLMIGRAAIGNPWIFREVKHFMKTGETLPPPTIQERLTIVRNHLTKSVDWKGEKLGILEMRKHYANYFKGIPNFKPHRMKLVHGDTLAELLTILDTIEKEFTTAL